MIHVRSETEKKNYDQTPPANVLESDSLLKLVTRWDQSPRNWHRRPRNIGTNPSRMETLPLVSCVMSHFERELTFEDLNN